MFSWLTKLFAGKGAEITDTVMKGLDELLTSSEEKIKLKLEIEKEVNRHLESVAVDITKQYELQLKDVSDARLTNVNIQNSDKASWLSKNISYIIDIFVCMVWGVMTFYLLAKWINLIKSDTPVDMTGILGVYAAVCGMFTQVLSYHRGSSKGSDDKQKTIDRMSTK